jgi:hypothetical protein
MFATTDLLCKDPKYSWIGHPWAEGREHAAGKPARRCQVCGARLAAGQPCTAECREHARTERRMLLLVVPPVAVAVGLAFMLFALVLALAVILSLLLAVPVSMIGALCEGRVRNCPYCGMPFDGVDGLCFYCDMDEEDLQNPA